jgi:hypothetical protein
MNEIGLHPQEVICYKKGAIMMTSNFGSLNQIPPDYTPVAISRGVPRGWKGRRELRLAPSWEMLKMSPQDYDRNYDALLSRLDARKLFEEIGDKTVLLCWEKPGFRCHRRRVAEWFEKELGIAVPELGDNVPPYCQMAAQPKRRSQRSKRRSPPMTGELFA